MHQKFIFFIPAGSVYCPSAFLPCFPFPSTAKYIVSLTKASQGPRNETAFVERACDSIPVITIPNQLDNWVGG